MQIFYLGALERSICLQTFFKQKWIDGLSDN